jgi:hypothetical protein
MRVGLFSYSDFSLDSGRSLALSCKPVGRAQKLVL